MIYPKKQNIFGEAEVVRKSTVVNENVSVAKEIKKEDVVVNNEEKNKNKGIKMGTIKLNTSNKIENSLSAGGVEKQIIKGNLKIYGLGGAGINIVNYVKNNIDTDENFANIEYKAIDTTEKTVVNTSLNDVFVKIKHNLSSKELLDGLAGERKNPKVVEIITRFLEDYVDSLGKPKKNDYYIMISSASGGSGSIINSILIREMLRKDFNVIPILVLDTSTFLYTTNSLNTLIGLHKIAQLTKSALPVLYFNNTLGNNFSNQETEHLVNQEITNFIKIFSIYTSGLVHNLDNQDINNFIKPTRFKTFNVAPGIYKLDVFSGVLDNPNVILSRSLRSEEKDIDIKINLLDNKTGLVVNEKHLELLDEILPMYTCILKNELNSEISELKAIREEQEKMKNLRTEEIEALSDSIEDEDGLIL